MATKFSAKDVLSKAHAKPKSTQKEIEKSKNISLPAADLYSANNHLAVETIKRIPAIEVDPKRCRPWKFHNRDESWLSVDNCADLISSIRANGQIEPGLVRKIENSKDYDYEIIYGVRRWYSVSQIKGKKFLAKVTQSNDRDCMILMHIENADSKDISDFERARSFLIQLRSGAFKSQNDLAETLNVSQALVSRMLVAAEIYDHDLVKNILPSMKDIPIKPAQEVSIGIRNAVTKKLILAKAVDIKENMKDIIGKPNKVLKELRRVISSSDDIKLSMKKTFFDNGKVKGVDFKVDSKGRLVLYISPKARKNEKSALSKSLVDAVSAYYDER